MENSVHQLEMIQQPKIQQLYLQQSFQPTQQQKQPQQQKLQQQNTIGFPANYANKYVAVQLPLLAQIGSYETGSAIQG